MRDQNLSDAIGLEIERRENTLPQRLRDMHPRAVNVSEWNTLAAAADYIEALEKALTIIRDGEAFLGSGDCLTASELAAEALLQEAER